MTKTKDTTLFILFSLFSFFRVIFPVRNNKSNQGNNKTSSKNNIKTCHILFLLFRWYGKKGKYKKYGYRNDNYNTGDRVNLFRQNSTNKAYGQQIFRDVHKHFTCFLPSLCMLHALIILQRKNKIINFILTSEPLNFLTSFFTRKDGQEW